MSDIGHLKLTGQLWARPSAASLVSSSSMRSLRLLPSIALGLGIFATAGVASAMPGITGESGKGGGDTCKSCHGSSASQPTFNVSLPDNVTANSTVVVTLAIVGVAGQALTSFDAAFDIDAIVTPGTNTRVPGSTTYEVTASNPPPAGVNGNYQFTVKVPNRNGNLNLWIAGISSNGMNDVGGDNTGTLVVTSTITGGPNNGATTAPADPATGTDTSTGATTSGVDAGPPVIIANPILPDGDPGCQSAPGHAPDLLWIAGVGAVVIGLGRRKRVR